MLQLVVWYKFTDISETLSTAIVKTINFRGVQSLHHQGDHHPDDGGSKQF
jgi:hypothetical protein